MTRAAFRISGLAAAAAVGLGACNQSDSGNVMAPGGNSLTPAQVDAALGPEAANEVAAPLNEADVQDAGRQSPPSSAPQRRPPPAAEAPEPAEPGPDTPVSSDNGT